MILAVDVYYTASSAQAGGVLFEHWSDKVAALEVVSFVHQVQAYESGNFYKRELPCILALLKEHRLFPRYIVIDGYVYLDGINKPGLGKQLYDAIKGRAAVIGVAKSPFKEISDEYAVWRGESHKPLFITAAGISLEQAKAHIRQMHGKHRLPTLLKRVDQLCRDNQGKI